MVWKALGREITALMACVYLTSVLCVQSETFPQLNDNTSDLRIFSTAVQSALQTTVYRKFTLNLDSSKLKNSTTSIKKLEKCSS